MNLLHTDVGILVCFTLYFTDSVSALYRDKLLCENPVVPGSPARRLRGKWVNGKPHTALCYKLSKAPRISTLWKVQKSSKRGVKLIEPFEN